MDVYKYLLYVSVSTHKWMRNEPNALKFHCIIRRQVDAQLIFKNWKFSAICHICIFMSHLKSAWSNLHRLQCLHLDWHITFENYLCHISCNLCPICISKADICPEKPILTARNEKSHHKMVAMVYELSPNNTHKSRCSLIGNATHTLFICYRIR